MRYGVCSGYATNFASEIDYALLDEICRCGFDYVEFPLMQIVDLESKEFERLVAHLAKSNLKADMMCNMFPEHIRLLGEEKNFAEIDAYLEIGFARMARLGTKGIMLGSAKARWLPEDYSEAQGYQELAQVMTQCMIPKLIAYDMTLLVEPISHAEGNFIHTVAQGVRLAQMVNHPRVKVLADFTHMIREGEPPDELIAHYNWIAHIHVAEGNRALPVSAYSPELDSLLTQLSQLEYDGTLSFESIPCHEENGFERARAMLLTR